MRSPLASSSVATIQIIAPAAKPRPIGSTLLKLLDEDERRNSEERLGQAREDAPPRGRSDAGAARNEHKADRESLRDVVDRDREGDHDAERGAHRRTTSRLPTPSATECAVITAMIKQRPCARPRPTARQDQARRPAKARSRVAATNTAPATAPARTRPTLRSPPSISRLRLAPSITPEAKAFARPSQFVP